MRNIYFLSILLIILSCQVNDQEDERKELQSMLRQIQDLANSEICVDASDWDITSYGHKACGGSFGYIAYSNKINVSAFLDLIKKYTNAEKNYNLKWGVISDCSLVAQPTGVKCENGKAVLYY